MNKWLFAITNRIPQRGNPPNEIRADIMEHFFLRDLTQLAIIGPAKAQLLKDELGIQTCEDLLKNYPFRYEDRTKQLRVAELNANTTGVYLHGYIRNLQKREQGKKRLIALFEDETGRVELIWFQNFAWVVKKLQPNIHYRIWGKPLWTAEGKIQFIHPEVSMVSENHQSRCSLLPLYPTTEKLKRNQLDSKGIAILQKKVFLTHQNEFQETLPTYLLTKYRLMDLKEAFQNIHFPANAQVLKQAQRRLKFEELFYIQLKLFKIKQIRLEKQDSKPFRDLSLFNEFFQNHLPFSLTHGQKEALRDMYRDLRSGKQMNRLLQGDVGSGKTIVAFLAMLIILGSEAQVAIMAPTEVLAKQHYARFAAFARQVNIHVALLTGSTKKKEREHMLYQLKTGILHIIVGTHAMLNEKVSFKELGFFVVDEQHRFGVAQRAGLLAKNQNYVPHILIMTATPIPRTLAMTFYGDLDVSTIYDLPEGRKAIKTKHFYENARLHVWQFIREQLALDRQVYIVYPLIEESAVLDYANLFAGYESITRDFPGVPIGVIHGKMDAVSKELEMRRFERMETRILVATTVIEVGINVPNATVMVVESAERFGLAQLHQLRGRVGRDKAQSYCILMTDYRLNQVAKKRIETMVQTTNGFEIAEIDLKLRGPGDLTGLQQSGMLHLKIADLSTDTSILEEARACAKQVIQQDPDFQLPQHLPISQEYARLLTASGSWSTIG